RRPLGLLLAGGGSLGSWQAGFLTRMVEEHGLQFDEVLGFSTGALSAAAYCLDRLEVYGRLWRDISPARVLRLRPRLAPPTLFANDSLWEFVANGGSDAEAMARARVPCTVILTERATGRRRYARFTPRGEGGWDAPFGAHLVASCAIPDIFPPVPIEEGGAVRDFADGGMPGDPPDFSVLARCRDVVVVEMVRPDEVGRWPLLNPVRFREHFVRRGLRRYVEEGLGALRGLPEPPRLLRVVPSQALDFSLIRFSSSVCTPAFLLGESDADAFAAEPLLSLETRLPSQDSAEMLFSRGLTPDSGESNGQL
ncbi:MAG: patatin-like phospholipase family protein, partial [Elusimicrobia bacterium]|nr:patatin-like phospholipase family protein [Elusimicrobiota bacterium]